MFSWLATMWEGRIHFTTPMLFALGFVSMFVIGGLSGIYLAAVPIDIHVSDTYFVVAHIHYVLFGGSLFTIFAGIYYWFPKMTGRMYDERLGKLHFWMTFIGFNITFFPMHWLGTQGMPRRVSDYAPRFADWNMMISIASFFLGASTIVFLYNMITSWVRGPKRRVEPVARRRRSSGRSRRRRRTSTSTRSRRSSAPVRVRRPGRPARRVQRRPERRVRRGASLMHVLVIANETVAGRALTEAVKRRDGDDLQVTVVCPVNVPREGYVVYQDTRRAAARRRLDKTLEDLREAGISADGFVVDADPVDAVRDALAQLEPPVDEIIVSTHPEQKSGWTAPARRRAHPEGCGRHPRRARRRRPRARGRRGERPRDRERDRARRRPARQDQGARRAVRRRAS